MGFSNFVFAIGLGIKRPLVGTETPVPLSPRNPQVLLEIKRPLVGTETILLSYFVIVKS